MRRLLATTLAAATTTLVTTLCAAAAPLPGVAPGAASLHLSRVHEAEGRQIMSAVRLDCPADAPATHPNAREACRDIRGAAGDLDRLPGQSTAFCAIEPGTTVTVTADGAYEGRPVHWTHTYADDCARMLATGKVFDF